MTESIFVLGPSEWADPANPWDRDVTPYQVRQRIVARLKALGADAFIMEDPDGLGLARNQVPHEPNPQAKFLDLVHSRDVRMFLIYWPPDAKMDTTQDEMVIVSTKHMVEEGWAAQAALFGHDSAVGTSEHHALEVREERGRSSYLGCVPRNLPTQVHTQWDTHGELLDQITDWYAACIRGPDPVVDDATRALGRL